MGDSTLTPPDNEPPSSFRRIGLPFFVLAASGIIQSAIMVQRLRKRRRSTAQNSSLPRRIAEWHRFLEESGVLLLCVGTSMDNLTKFMAAFQYSWPDTIWLAPTAAVATEHWTYDNQRGASIQVAMFWICAFFHLVLSPVAIYSVLSILRIGLRLRIPVESKRLPDHSSDRMWFCLSTFTVLHLMSMGLFGLIAGPMASTVQVRYFSDLITLQSSQDIPLLLGGLLGVVLWQVLLLVTQLTLWLVLDGKKNQTAPFLVLVANLLSFWMQSSRPGRESEEGMRLVRINCAEQIAIATHMWADALYNPVDSDGVTQDHGPGPLHKCKNSYSETHDISRPRRNKSE